MAMASPSPTSSYAPSSSAVTIPVPGRSILKRPPPTQQSFFSRLSKFLPTPAQAQASATSGDESKTLKRAHFILPELVTVYPISSANPPSMPTLKEEKKTIEQREMERRRRVVRGSPSASSSGETDEWWSMDKVESFYRECSTSRDDQPSPDISAAFKVRASFHVLVRSVRPVFGRCWLWRPGISCRRHSEEGCRTNSLLPLFGRLPILIQHHRIWLPTVCRYLPEFTPCFRVERMS